MVFIVGLPATRFNKISRQWSLMAADCRMTRFLSWGKSGSRIFLRISITVRSSGVTFRQGLPNDAKWFSANVANTSFANMSTWAHRCGCPSWRETRLRHHSCVLGMWRERKRHAVREAWRRLISVYIWQNSVSNRVRRSLRLEKLNMASAFDRYSKIQMISSFDIVSYSIMNKWIAVVDWWSKNRKVTMTMHILLSFGLSSLWWCADRKLNSRHVRCSIWRRTSDSWPNTNHYMYVRSMVSIII